jgi:hypothetical protein
MARGWESKSVEDQVEQSQSKGESKKKAQMSAAQVDVNRRREVLLLSRKRVERELESSQNARYKEQLNRALADLDAQLASLEEKE